MAAWECPYCGADNFVGATTAQRGRGEVAEDGFTLINQTWENECAACGRWSVHDDADHAQHPLADPWDRTSPITT